MPTNTSPLLEALYQPTAIEPDALALWKEIKAFRPQMDSEKSPYCILIPPPNVTGVLHMGHAFQHTLIDILVRYQRMCGKKTCWLFGTDHAGISTQMVVERQLLQEGLSRKEIGRHAFLERTWKWTEYSQKGIKQQIQRLGASVDPTRECFTMNAQFSQAVQAAFIRLYNDGLIYRGTRLVNWDPTLQTAVSDLEVTHREQKQKLYTLAYHCEEGTVLQVATTRPETLFGDEALAVHPDDLRYQHLIGKKATIPLANRQIPIIASEAVDPEFGTGALKITPAHDWNDARIAKTHHLPERNILHKDGRLNAEAGEFANLSTAEARIAVIKALKAQNLLLEVVDHTHSVPYSERTGAVIEPYLTTQWYIKMQPFAEMAKEAVASGAIRFIPEHWKNTYYHWIENLEDWCISRQLWWGHRIPVWYDQNGNHYAGESEQAIRSAYQLPDTLDLHQDDDVLDTWFSSALWPIATMGWPNHCNSDDFQQFFPSSVLVTGFDIIFFWVARMIMFTQYFTGKNPFPHIYVHGLILDAQGQKMSKSKGNVLDPIDLIDGISLEKLLEKRTVGLMQEKHLNQVIADTKKHFPNGIAASGTDALRMTFSSLASLSSQVRFDIKRLEGYRNFCNKLWNAARFVHMQIPADYQHQKPSPEIIAQWHPIDRWIYQAALTCAQTVAQQLTDYRFDLATETIFAFFWNQFCDWYIECAKLRLNDSANHPAPALIESFDIVLRVLHPFMPFITENIWQHFKMGFGIAPDTECLAVATYPHIANTEAYPETVLFLHELVHAIRSLRSQRDIPPSKKIPLWADDCALLDKKIGSLVPELMHLAKISEIKPVDSSQQVLSVNVEGIAYHLPLADCIDIAAERERLAQQMSKQEKLLAKIQQKMASPAFAERAPEAVVAATRKELAECEATIQTLRLSQQSLEKLR